MWKRLRRGFGMDAGDARTQKVIAAFRLGVIRIAEQKLGRSLTNAERAGIQHIDSMMTLESCEHAYSASSCTPERVLADLAQFAEQARRR